MGKYQYTSLAIPVSSKNAIHKPGGWWNTNIAQPLSQRSNCCRSRKCIRYHIPVHAIFAVFLSIFLFLLVLSRPSFTYRTPNKDQKTEQLFFQLVQVPSPGDIHELSGKRFCACYLQALTKVPRSKSRAFMFPWMDSHDSSTI